MITLKSVLKLILILNILIANIYSNQANVKIDYLKIKEMYESGRDTSKKGIVEQLKKITTDALFKISEDASIANNRIIMFELVGTELLRRTKQQKVDVNNYLYQLNREDINPEYEYLLLWVINSSYKVYSSVELKQLIEVTTQSIKLPQRSFEQKLMAIVTSNTILGELIVANQISKRKISEYSYLLNSIMMDKGENSEIRRAAIKGIQLLDFKESTGNLMVLVSNKSIINDPPLGRSVCIALAHFKVMSALPHIGYILANTNDEYIFASAAIVLGELGGEYSLKMLIDNENRFSGDYCGVAVRNMDDLVFKILSSNNSEMLPYAVKGTKYLYDGYQKNPKDKSINQSLTGVNLYKPLLISILWKTSDKKLIKLILQSLTQIINKQDAKIIIEIIPRDSIYADEWDFINNFVKMKKIKSKESKIPTDESFRNNTETQEYGDPGYRDNNFGWAGLVDWLGHTGLCAGIDYYNYIRIIEVAGFNPNVVRHNYWSSMQNDDNYWGANTLNNYSYYMNFDKRRNVMNTAVELLGYDIGYPVIPPPDALWYVLFPGHYVSPDEITALRCDGLVEYCYEWNNYWVWGANGTHYDISVTDYVSEHNDFYDPLGGYDPDTELAPIVQGGYAGGSSTHMNWEAQTDEPTYDAGYTINGYTVTVSITATDRSGIHYIKYKVGSGGSYSSSPVQPQHPNNSSYTYQFSVTMNQSDYVYYYAKDNGGNYPDYAEYIYIDFNSGVEDDLVFPEKFSLHQNYPNPFNTATTINYKLNKSSFINLSVYNVNGELVETLINERNDVGNHSVEWDAESISSDVYFYRITTGEYTETKKCLLLK